MHCKHCGFVNSEEDHRCLRCGRRITGVVIAAPPGYSGANALAMAPLQTKDSDTLEFEPTTVTTAGQGTLFASPGPKVIPFEQVQRQVTARLGMTPTATAPPTETPRQATARPAVRKASGPPAEQAALDFLPAPPLRSPKLRNDVDAQIFCGQPVATPTHRFVASAIDGALILIGFGVLVLTFQALGGSFGVGKQFWLGLGAALAVVSLFYGLIWVIAGRETAGMSFTDLQLITFDGFRVDGRSRALRFAATWLSIGSGLLGVVWALADEESLTWHDHISKTFPTIREAPRAFVKQRR